MSVDSGMLVAKLVGDLGGVTGRKRLQKIIHLLQESRTRDFGYRFILHYFGPYSRELASDLDFLSDVKILKEEAPEGGQSSYKYTITEGAVREEVNQFFDEDSDSRWIERARKLADEDVPLLEAVSTIVFLAKRRKLEGLDLKSRFEELKPSLKGLYEKAHRYAETEGYLA